MDLISLTYYVHYKYVIKIIIIIINKISFYNLENII